METAINRVTTSLRMRSDIKALGQKMAEKTHRSLCNYIEYLILKDNNKYDYPYSDNIPNEETAQVIRETMQGIGVSDVDTSSREAMLQSLGFYEED